VTYAGAEDASARLKQVIASNVVGLPYCICKGNYCILEPIPNSRKAYIMMQVAYQRVRQSLLYV